MPPLRPSRLASRKSIVPDRTTYDPPSDDSLINSNTPNPHRVASNGSTGISPRRSARISNEGGAEMSPIPIGANKGRKRKDPPPADSSTASGSPGKGKGKAKGKEKGSTAKGKKGAPRSKGATGKSSRVEHDEDEEEEVEEEEGSIIVYDSENSGEGEKKKEGGKRAKLGTNNNKTAAGGIASGAAESRAGSGSASANANASKLAGKKTAAARSGFLVSRPATSPPLRHRAPALLHPDHLPLFPLTSVGTSQPRAAQAVLSAGSTSTSVNLDPEPEPLDEGDSADSFAFTTVPPTPYAVKASRAAEKERKEKEKEKDGGKVGGVAGGAGMGRSKRVAEHAAENERLAKLPRPSTPPPVASTSANNYAPITVNETPKIYSNIAYRNGQGPGTPASLGKGTPGGRRASVDRRGKRLSSIGSGFDALPHDSIEDSRLYRSTNANAPVAIRLRSILSWSAQRVRDREFRLPPPSVSTTELTREERERILVRKVIDRFVEDVCASRLDVSGRFKEAEKSKGKNKKEVRLPKHPQNVANELKLDELKGHFATIEAESKIREHVLSVYQAFEESHSSSINPAPSTSTSAPASKSTSTPTSLLVASSSKPLSIPRRLKSEKPTTREDGSPLEFDQVLQLGRELLRISIEDGNSAPPPQASVATSKKGKGKEVDLPPPRDGSDSLDVDSDSSLLRQVLIKTPALKSTIHLLTSLISLSSSYVSLRTAQLHSTLSEYANSSTTGAQVAGEGGLARIVGMEPKERAGGEAGRDLLRGIARAGMGTGTGRGR